MIRVCRRALALFPTSLEEVGASIRELKAPEEAPIGAAIEFAAREQHVLVAIVGFLESALAALRLDAAARRQEIEILPENDALRAYLKDAAAL